MERKNKTEEQQMTISRIINAPRKLVWKAWTDPKQVKKWWGPKGFTNPVCEWTAKAGNKILVHMQGPDGIVYPMDGEFVEIKEPEKLVFISAALDKDGKRLFEVVNTISFITKGDKTELILHVKVSKIKPGAHQYLAGMSAGWSQSLDKLEELVSENPPFIIERFFNAPVSKIWKAITDKAEMKKWYFDIEEFKPEIGFKFQFVAGAKDGKPYLHLCEITEVIPGKKLTYSWRYDGYPGNSLVTWELFEMGKNTLIKLTHRGIETLAPGHPDFRKENFKEGWTYFMDSALKGYLEKGSDKK